MSHTKCSNPMVCKCLCDTCAEALVAQEIGDLHFERHRSAFVKAKLFLALTHEEAENLVATKLGSPKETTTNSCTRGPAKPKFAVGELVLNKNRETFVVNSVSFVDGRYVYSATAIFAAISDGSRLAGVSARSIYEEALIEASLEDHRSVTRLLLRRIFDGVAYANDLHAQSEAEIQRLRKLLEQKPTNGRPQRCVTIETDHGWDD